MDKLRVTFYIVAAVTVLYLLDVTIVVDFIDSGKDTWNYLVDYVLTFRYKQPIAFLLLPFIAVYLLGKK